jgi:hypothetical protein
MLFLWQVPTEVAEEEAAEDSSDHTEKPLVALGVHRTASNRRQASSTGSFIGGARGGQHRSIRTPAARRQASLRMANSIIAATASSTDAADSSHQHHHGHHGLHLPGLHHHHGSHGGQRSGNTSNDGGVTAVISPRAPAPANALAVVGSPFNGSGANAAGGVMLHEVKVLEGTAPPDWPATGGRCIVEDHALLPLPGSCTTRGACGYQVTYAAMTCCVHVQQSCGYLCHVVRHSCCCHAMQRHLHLHLNCTTVKALPATACC